jgi:site-specific recombinase XerD
VTRDLVPLEPKVGIERFISHNEPSWRESTLRNSKTRLRFFREFLASEEIENLNELDGRVLSDFVSWRRDDLAAITLQKQLTTVRKALRFWANLDAVRKGLAEQLHAPELPDGAESDDTVMEVHRVERLLEFHENYDRASRRHVLAALIWRTGMRRSAVRSIDVDDLLPDDNAVQLRHRPETETYLKNGYDGERVVYLGPKWMQIVSDYVEDRRRPQTDDHGREPLLTTRYGRPAPDTLTDNCYRLTRPCQYTNSCPVGREIEECDGTSDPHHCPCKRGPHAWRRSAISEHLREGTNPDTVSERMDVSLEVLYRHYDIRNDREKMQVRREDIPDQ